MNYVDAFVSVTSVLEIYVATSTETTLPNAVLIRLTPGRSGCPLWRRAVSKELNHRPLPSQGSEFPMKGP